MYKKKFSGSVEKCPPGKKGNIFFLGVHKVEMGGETPRQHNA